MSEPRKKPGVAFWGTVVVVCLPLIYVLGFGPACWLAARDAIPARIEKAAATVYEPLILCALRESHPAARALQWWAGESGDGAIILWGYLPIEDDNP